MSCCSRVVSIRLNSAVFAPVASASAAIAAIAYVGAFRRERSASFTSWTSCRMAPSFRASAMPVD